MPFKKMGLNPNFRVNFDDLNFYNKKNLNGKISRYKMEAEIIRNL